MSEEQTGSTTATEETTTQDGFKAITSQDELNKIIQARIAREREKFADYDEAKQAQARLAEIEEANKTELEKAYEQASTWKQKYDELQKATAEKDKELLRLNVIAKYSIPEDDQILVHGSSEEELVASAERVAALRTTTTPEARSVATVGQTPARKSANTPLREQIAAAEKAGDTHLVAQLKAVMIGELSKSQ